MILSDIYNGWMAYFRGENTALAKLRLRMCDVCPFKKKTWIGGFCGKCGCYLEAKARCFVCECPDDRWYN